MNRQFSFKDPNRTHMNRNLQITSFEQSSSNKIIDSSWTDQRVEQIKKKYEIASDKNHQQNKNQLFDQKNDKQKSQESCLITQAKRERGILTDSNRNSSIKVYINNEKESSANRLESGQDYGKAKNSYQLRRNYDSEIQNDKQIIDLKRQTLGHDLAKKSGLYTHETFYMRPSLREKFSSQFTNEKFYPSTKAPDSKSSVDRGDKNSFVMSGKRESSVIRNSRPAVQDPRVQNIDKINLKIKRILFCIQKEQRTNGGQSQIENLQGLSRSKVSNSFLGRSTLSRQYRMEQKQLQCFNQLQQTKILQKQKIIYRADQRGRTTSKVTHGIQHSQIPYTRLNDSKYCYKIYGDKNRNANYVEKVDRIPKRSIQKQKIEARPSSFVNNISQDRTSMGTDSVDVGSKAEKIEEQIQKFEKKIAQLQEEKRKLNIQFKPYNFQRSPMRRIATQGSLEQEQEERKLKNNRSVFFNRNASKQNCKERFTQVSQNISFGEFEDMEKAQKQISRNEVEEPTDIEIFPKKFTFSNICGQETNHYAKPQIQSQVDKNCFSRQQVVEKAKSQMKKFKFYDNQELRRRIGERIQDRKKRILMYDKESDQKKDYKETSKMIKTLCQQVKLDEEFRNSKNWFLECQHPDKIQSLRKLLLIKGVQMTQEAILQQFNLLEQQNDPFFSFREERYDIQSVAENFIQSKKHWIEQILHNWDIQKMINEENLLSRLGADIKQEISIEDFVRFLNMESGNFYRNRDIFLIFKRIICQNLHKDLQDSQSLKVETFKKVLSNKH